MRIDQRFVALGGWIVCTCLISGCASAPPPDPFSLAEAPFVQTDPSLDGQATRREEWDGAVRLPDLWFASPTARAGFYYLQSRMDWEATSVQSGARTTYPGLTQFVSHDIIGSGDPDSRLHQFQQDDEGDWNSFDVVTPSGNVKIWVFDDQDTLDDAAWLRGAEGLDRSSLLTGSSGNRIDDRGWVARANDDPSTDVHWMRGMDEPGDPGWDWDAWHGVFGRHTFGSSFQDTGIDSDPENRVPHEVYEVAVHDPNPRDRSVQPDGSPPDDDAKPWCLWWEWVTIDLPVSRPVLAPKDGQMLPATLTTIEEIGFWVLRGDFWLHLPPPLFEYETALSLAALVTNELDVVIEQTESQEARAELGLARSAFNDAFAEGLEGGDYDLLFEQLDAAYGHLDNAKETGATARSVADIEIQALSVVGTFGAEQVIAMDDAGMSMDDPALQELYGALYDFGGAAREVSDRERTPRSAVGELQPVFRGLSR